MRSIKPLLFAAVLAALAMGLSQESGGASLETAQGDLGTYLTDGEGSPLYVFTQDEGESSCYDECAQAWPPFAVEEAPAAGTGVAGSLIGTIERSDGSLQATYSGQPLYYFAEDADSEEPGGHGLNGEWFLISAYGSTLPAPRAEAPAEEDEGEEGAEQTAGDVPQELMQHGAEVYSMHCVACHGAQGQGSVGPSLTNQNRIGSEGQVINQILFGSSYMPAFRDVLSDDEVAAVATYLRNSFGNSYGVTTPDEVSERR